ncbi:polysaccharide biosynthesis protein, partial [Armatimonadetes bacterium]|nr:polysaccharide biosynthesis protein [bacterium]
YLVDCADYYKCKMFVLISTDKDVNTTSMMGATKSAAVLVIQYMNKVSETQYAAVRFGNVLGSNGSVIPLFKKQIAYGGPITITHPDVSRYFMTISEAASLVIQSGAMMEGGEIFILDMGEQIKILELAKALITLSGLKLDKDISIEFIGLRPGEKLKEELFISEGEVTVTKSNKIYMEMRNEIDLESTMKLIQAYRLKPLEQTEDAVNFIKKLVGPTQ